MDYFEIIEKRFSCREFTEEKIKREELDKILEAGIVSPTACNFQPERIIVIENEEILGRLKEATRFTFNAKTILVVCHDTTVSWHRGNDGVDHGIVDSSIVATQMVLAATYLGIGSCYVCSMKANMVKDILELPESYMVDILLPIGYPKEEKPHNTRKDLEELVSYR